MGGAAASTAFYSGLFGWDSDDQYDDRGNRIYTNYSCNGQLVAGGGPQPPEMQGAPPVWNTYIAVDDVDETAGRSRARAER